MNLLPWTYVVDGDDLVVRNIIATCFGGKYDKGDNGQTESGIPNDGRDLTLLGCALPIRSIERATAPSPLAFKGPHIPWGTKVKVWRERDGESKSITCVLIDNGPNVLLYPTHALDLNPNAARLFRPDIAFAKLANAFMETGMSYRVVGGAKHIS